MGGRHFHVHAIPCRVRCDVGDSAYAWDEATRQLIIYGSHLQRPSGPLQHAFDELRSASWADEVTGLSPEGWCRAIGWFGRAAVQVLDVISANHPRRAAVVTMVQNLIRGLAAYQDPATGRWFQVVNKGDRSDNWTETSCSSMATYVIDKALEVGTSLRATMPTPIAATRACSTRSRSGWTA